MGNGPVPGGGEVSGPTLIRKIDPIYSQDGMVRRIRAEWPGGATPRVIATGGLAALIAPLSSSIEQVDRDLTLRGLMLAAGHLGLEW